MAANETFSFDTVAVLVANLSKKGMTLGMKDYAQMAKLDGKRTASSFDHGFRKVKARARELLAEAGEDVEETPKKGKGGGKAKTPAVGEKKDGGKRSKMPSRYVFTA